MGGLYLMPWGRIELVKLDEARVRQSKWADGTPCRCECILYKGHRCGACHNASDAKVRITKARYEMKMGEQDKKPECSLKV